MLQVSLLTQGPSEESNTFTERVNQELARLGGTVKEVRMATAIHEVSITGRLAIPRVLNTVMILFEKPA